MYIKARHYAHFEIVSPNFGRPLLDGAPEGQPAVALLFIRRICLERQRVSGAITTGCESIPKNIACNDFGKRFK
jgi:hypothetical protein